MIIIIIKYLVYLNTECYDYGYHYKSRHIKISFYIIHEDIFTLIPFLYCGKVAVIIEQLI